MSSMLWDDIRDRMADHVHMAGVDRATERIKATAEIFTPTDLVLEMLCRLPLDLLQPSRTVLDPACGDGQFLVAAKWVKVLHFGMTEQEALADIYGIDIMADNVAVCRARLGGGTIVVGDALDPMRRVPGQTDADRQTLLELLDNSAQLELFAG